jgi:TetR/AcrR family transcriptional regulator, transcriptional repressor for nem operon
MTPTASRIVDVAERLVQTCGYNGFSYADISAELGITKASLHHHFPSKAALGKALVMRYSELFMAALADIDRRGGSAYTRLKRYGALYEDVLRQQRLCLCGMLAAEYATLPKAMQEEIRRFFDVNEAWLAGVIDEGRRARTLTQRGSPQATARMLLAALEGAMLVARPYNDATRFSSAASHILDNLKAPVARPVRRSA